MVINFIWYNWNFSILVVFYEVFNNVMDLNESSIMEELVDFYKGLGEFYILVESIIIGIIFFFFIFVVVFGNVLVCVVVFKDRRF